MGRQHLKRHKARDLENSQSKTVLLTESQKIISEVLASAQKAIVARQEYHGDMLATLESLAHLHTGYLRSIGVDLKRDLNVRDAAFFMALLKIARANQGTFNDDDFVDGAAYLAAGILHVDFEDPMLGAVASELRSLIDERTPL